MKKRIISLFIFSIFMFVGCGKSITKDNSNEQTKTTNNTPPIEVKNTENKKANEKEEIKKEESQKQVYLKKLNDIEAGLKDLSKKYEGTTLEMKEAASEEYKRWDKALNEIYSVLKDQLSDSEMKELKEKQIQWISIKEKKAKEESLEYQGGTMESLIYISSLAKTTKDRCYELVEEYMVN